VFINSGSFTEAIKELYQKGLKAYFKFRKCFEHHEPKIKTLKYFIIFKMTSKNNGYLPSSPAIAILVERRLTSNTYLQNLT
jgi:hypothetical protein